MFLPICYVVIQFFEKLIFKMPVGCSLCEKFFANQGNLKRHKARVHKVTQEASSYDKSKWNFKCLQDDCNNSFQYKAGLTKHLSAVHNIPIETEELEFESNQEFLEWKQLIEKTEKSNYVVSATSHTKDNLLVTYYSCNRSGKVRFRTSCNSNNKKGLMKAQGSCKLNRNCISSLKVTECEKVLVTWIRTHYGHSLDLQHIRVPKIDKSAIASKLVQGVTPSRILDTYRDNIDEENINREDLITRKDIHNIKRAVDLWVAQCEKDYSNTSSEDESTVEVEQSTADLSACIKEKDILRQN